MAGGTIGDVKFDCVDITGSITVGGVPFKDYISACMIENGLLTEADVKAIFDACIAAGVDEGGVIADAIKACIGDAVMIVQVPTPGEPGSTTTTITVPGKPPVSIKTCCSNAPPVVTSPDTGDPGNPAGPSTVTISGVTFCEGATGAVYDKPQNPYPSNPTGRLAQEHGGRDGKDEVWLQAPEHYSSCIEGNSTTRVWYDINAPAGTTVERLLEYQISLTNLSDCRRASVTVSHTGHTLGAFYMPGDEFFVFSGDRVFINGFQGSWATRSVSWQFQNATSLRATFEAANQGYEGCYKLGPLATLRADIFTRTASAGSFPTIISTHNPAGTVLEQMHGSMHLTTE